jgi:peptidoglycan hydrolase CwlO-like protein
LKKKKLNIQAEIDTIKVQMEEKKSEYLILKEKVDKIKLKENELKSEIG